MTLAATLTFISDRDHTLMRRVNRWHPPRWIRVWMLCATRGGDGWLWYAIGLVILLLGGGQRFAAIGAAALAAAAGIAAFLHLKKATGRQRPCALEPHCWATLLPPDQFSFPSGHTITAFAVAVSLSLFYPELALGLLFCALSVAASRILLGMHFLSDVVAGAAIGTALAYGAVGCATRSGQLVRAVLPVVVKESTVARTSKRNHGVGAADGPEHVCVRAACRSAQVPAWHAPAPFGSLVVGVEFAAEIPEMLPGVIEIHDLNGAGELFLAGIPDPRSCISFHFSRGPFFRHLKWRRADDRRFWPLILITITSRHSYRNASMGLMREAFTAG